MPAHHYSLPSQTDLRVNSGSEFDRRNDPVVDLRQRLAGTNINQTTFLATDYLNHFNEIEMLIEMLPSMPECFEDICTWQPKSYECHFSDSGFRDKDLAILAYQQAPQRVRKRFDEIITVLDRCIIDAIETLKETYEMGAPEHLGGLSENLGSELRRHIDQASAIINGHNENVATSEMSAGTAKTRDSIESTQAAVEALFGD